MTQLNTLIAESVDQYTEMRVLLLRLESELENSSASGIAQLVSQFNMLCSDTRNKDRIITHELTSQGVNEIIYQQLESRRNLQAEIISLIEKNLPKANTVKSLYAEEVNSLKKGRKAMNGYKNNSGDLGRIINNSS